MTRDTRLKIGVTMAIVALVAIWFVAGARNGKPIEAKPDAAIAPEPSASVASTVEEGAAQSASPPLDECATLEAASRAVFSAAVDGCALLMPSLPCTRVGGATWAFRMRSVKGTCMESSFEIVAWRSGDGGVAEEDAGTVIAAGDDVLEIHTLADYDGDGVDEVFVEQRTKSHEEDPRVIVYRILSLRNGAIVPYPPAAKIAIAGAEDIDGDGKPDLVTRGPFGVVKRWNAVPQSFDVAPLWFAYHARPDGSFAVDAASQAYALKKCPAKPTLSLSGDEDKDAEAIVCAKLWGVPTAEIVRAIGTACPNHDADPSSCADWEIPLAKIAAPFTLK